MTDQLSPGERFHRWNREEYHRLAEIGVLTADDQVELLDGLIFDNTDRRRDLHPPGTAFPVHRWTAEQMRAMIDAGLVRSGTVALRNGVLMDLPLNDGPT